MAELKDTKVNGQLSVSGSAAITKTLVIGENKIILDAFNNVISINGNAVVTTANFVLSQNNTVLTINL